jgi:hypothetical protein
MGEGQGSGRWAREADSALAFLLTIAALAVYASALHREALAFGVLCLLLGIFFATLIHELGHAAAAAVCGWRVVMVVARPIGIQVPNRNVAWVAGPSALPAESGWVVCVPKSPEVNRPQRWRIILAAGPAASLAASALALGAWMILPPPSPSPGVAAGRLCLGFALQSFRLGLATLDIAGTNDGRDGAKLRALRRDPSTYPGLDPVIWLETLTGSKLRLRERPEWLLNAAKTAALSSPETAKRTAMFEIGVTLDSSPVDVEEARLRIAHYRARFGADRWLVACEAYLAAIWERDPDRGAALLAESAPGPDVPELDLAAGAAVAARSGDVDNARLLLKAMCKELRRGSPFRDPTYRDIEGQIRAVIAEAKAFPLDDACGA